MSTTGFPVPQDGSGNGCTAAMMRRIVASHWATDGVVDGMRVSGGTSMEYTVSPGVAVIPMGANRSQGYVEAYCEGGRVATTPNPGTTPRVDAVWVMAHDLTFGDADNLVTLGVTQGAPAVAPKAPSIPTRATLICDVQVPAGATSTAGAVTYGSYHSAVPYGTAGGILLDKVDTSGAQVAAAQSYTFATGSIYLPSRQLVSVHLTATLRAVSPTTHDWEGSGYVDWLLDGAVMRTFRFLLSPDTPTTHCHEDYREVAAGSHTVAARVWGSNTRPSSGVRCEYGGTEWWPGQRLTVIGEQMLGD